MEVVVWAATQGLRTRRWISTLFFFQAEDGIRDHCVTGVQTCALPISTVPFTLGFAWTAAASAAQAARRPATGAASKIGRASCRERVERWAGDGGVSRKGEFDRAKSWWKVGSLRARYSKQAERGIWIVS